MNNQKTEISIPIGESSINGTLHSVEQAQGLIIFAHGSGSSRFSKRNNFVADILNQANFSTLLFDLLTEEEERIDVNTREFRFDISLLADRLVLVTNWIKNNKDTANLSIGYFGSSTGAAAALIAAAQLPKQIAAVVSRGGRPDLAKEYLPLVKAPTLLIVGALDYDVITLNGEAFEKMTCEKRIILVPDATHLFEEEGTLERAAELATDWFKKYV